MTPEPTENPPSDEPTLDSVLDQLDDTDTLTLRARESLEETLGALKLTPEEERALAPEIAQLRELTRKLDETTIEIAARSAPAVSGPTHGRASRAGA